MRFGGLVCAVGVLVGVVSLAIAPTGSAGAAARDATVEAAPCPGTAVVADGTTATAARGDCVTAADATGTATDAAVGSTDLADATTVTVAGTEHGAAAPGPPDRPTSVAATVPGPGSRSTTVTWTAPGGEVPSVYQVRCIPVGLPFHSGPSDLVRYVWSGVTWATVNDLGGGRGYRCYVRARYGPDPFGAGGEAAEGPLSEASDVVVVPVTAPLAPVRVQATEPAMPDGRATVVSFAAPVDVSGSPITGYTVACGSGDGGVARSAAGTASPITVTGLTAGKRYVCTARSANGVGQSPQSSWSNQITVPGGPVGNVTASAPSATRPWTFVRYQAPDGGPPVTYYVVACVPNGGGTIRTDVTRELQAQVSGLVRGTTYRCRVTAAYSGRGSGPPSAWSNAITVPR